MADMGKVELTFVGFEWICPKCSRWHIVRDIIGSVLICRRCGGRFEPVKPALPAWLTQEGGEPGAGDPDGDVCWFCDYAIEDPDQVAGITVECETPGGKPCPARAVNVHYGCLMDIDP